MDWCPNEKEPNSFTGFLVVFIIIIIIITGWDDKIVDLKTTLQLYFKTFIENINSGNLIM